MLCKRNGVAENGWRIKGYEEDENEEGPTSSCGCHATHLTS